MGKCPVPALLRAFLLLLTGILFLAPQLKAQTDFTIGTGTTGNGSSTYPCPLADYNEGNRAQYLFLASELQAMGMSRGYIKGLKFKVTNLNSVGVLEQYSIKIGTTSTNSLSATTWETGTTQLFGPVTYVPVDGDNVFTFTSDFFWNGTSNLIVEVCNNGASRFFPSPSANPTIAWTEGLAFNASHTYAANQVFNICGVTTTTEAGTATTRPNITFTWTTAPPDCTGVPDAGTALASASSACSVQPFTLSLKDVSNVRILTYQWQSSPDNTTWTNIPGATGATHTVAQNAATYYRAIVKCSFSGLTANSASVFVDAPAGVSGNFTIDNSLPASSGNSFKSFAEAINHIKCGINGPVVFNVVNTGTPYYEQVIMNEIAGTSSANTITFNGNGSSVLFTATLPEQAAVFKLNGTDYVTIDNLVITAAGALDTDYGFGIQVMNDADYNIIRNCTININPTSTNNRYSGIVMSASTSGATTTGNTKCDNNLIENNTINGGTYGITLIGSTTIAIQNNRVLNNTIRNFYEKGIVMMGNSGTIVEGNDFTRPDRTSSIFTQTGGSRSIVAISMETLSMNLRISKNRIHAIKDSEQNSMNDVYGIANINCDADVDFENIISNNLIYDIKGHGGIFALYNFGSNGTFYFHNTISLDEANSKATAITAGIYYTTTVTWGMAKNNQVSILRGGPGLKYGIYFATTPTLFTSDYNNYFVPAGPLNHIGFINAEGKATLADWRTASGQDANSLNTDPGYQAAASFDFKPSSAILNDKGTPVPVTIDINNASRSTSVPDMGAYEFSLAACLTNSNPGAAFTSLGSSACPDKPIALNLKNNDVGLGLTYQWQSAASESGPWTNISDPLQYPAFNTTTGASTIYFRAAVSCNGGTPVYSAVAKVVVGQPFPAGTYTIDKNAPTDPTGTKNFNSFKDAVDAISCGIAGPVVFNVKDGVYTEQVRITGIPGTSPVNTVTFRSESNDASKVELTYAATDQFYNYVLQLDSARHINFRAMTITAPAYELGRVIEFANTAAYDSIVNCVINTAISQSELNTSAGIFAASSFKGGFLYIKGNKINGGAKGVFINGPSLTVLTEGNTIDGNTFRDTYHQVIVALNTKNTTITNNDIDVNSTYSATSFNQGTFGVHVSNTFGATVISGNKLVLRNNTGNITGIFFNNSDAGKDAWSQISGNRIVALENISGQLNGIYVNEVEYVKVFNNVVSVKSSKEDPIFLISAALHSSNAKHSHYYNNSLLNTSTTAGWNVAVNFNHQYYSGGGNTRFNNNVAINKGGGPVAFYNYTSDFVKSDYNLMYTTGSVFVRRGPRGGSFEKNYANIAEWRAAYSTDLNSIVYEPAITSDDNLEPVLTNAGVWAMQGRGIQIPGNDKDINGNVRSATLTDGVPDLGAFEFHPTVEPPVLTGVPAVPVAGETQHFMMGSDTVAKVTWTPGADVPATIGLKRYSGVLPAGLAATEKSLYYYTDMDVTGSGTFKYDLTQFYIEPWMRNIPAESFLKHGRTDATDKWIAGTESKIDTFANYITELNLDYLDKLTGMTDGKKPERPDFVTRPDSSNLGTRFWLPYGFMRQFKVSNGQQLKLYLTAEKATQVTVKVNGTAYSKTYDVPANGVVVTDEVPKAGANDARIWEEGWSDRGILVESVEPIGLFAYVQSGTTKAMIMPTGTYGYEYTGLNFRQYSGYPDYGLSTMQIIADHDNTVVEITPAVPTEGGRAAGVPFRVSLNRGEVYQVVGAFKQKHLNVPPYNESSYEGYELSGTTVVSVPNASGECHPIAVFSGSAGTSIRCEDLNQHGGEAVLLQQNFPNQGWGKHYLTAPLSTANGAREPIFHIYRVLVKDPNTQVKLNGVTLTNLVNNKWYEYSSNKADYIEASQPVMVAQYNPFFTSCGNDYYFAAGIQEGMTYLTPLGHGIRKANFFRNRPTAELYPFYNYLTLVVPDEGLNSLKIDGTNVFDSVYAHNNKPGYSVVVKRWRAGVANGVVECDTTFTGMSSMSGNGAYFYNIGRQIPRPEFNTPSIHNVYNISGRQNTYTCAGTPFKPSVMLPVMPKTLTWKLSAVAGMEPAADVTENNPVPVDTVEINFIDYYVFTLGQEIKIANTGDYAIPVSATYANTMNNAGCDNTLEGVVNVPVIAAPNVDFTTNYNGCVTSEAVFTATGTASMAGEVIDRWKWNFGDNTTSTDQNPTKKFTTAGEFKVVLEGIATDGCVGTKETPITVTATPKVTLEKDSIGICPDGAANFKVKDPKAGVIYNWYDAAEGGTALGTGSSFDLGNVTDKGYVYVDATENGCGTETRTRAVAYIIPVVPAPVLSVQEVEFYSVTFSWQAVPGATGYEVSTNNGVTWTTPSSGSTGLTHTMNGLQSKQTVTLIVRSKGGCQDNESEAVSATTLDDKIFIPNTFTPNGDGKNDVLKVYAQGVQKVTMLIYNQWGQQIFQSNDLNNSWNGTYNGKPQPTGVYMYVCQLVLIDGKTIVKKGSVNLVR